MKDGHEIEDYLESTEEVGEFWMSIPSVLLQNWLLGKLFRK